MRDQRSSAAGDEQRAYLELCDEARALGIPTSLDDPRSPRTVDALGAAVAALTDPEYADVEEDGQLSLSVVGEQRSIPGLAPPRPDAIGGVS
jgi:hypothetical protein